MIPSPKRISSVRVGRYTFDADFDSGNCARVEAAGAAGDEFVVWTAADCEGTGVSTQSKTWFHFSVAGGEPGAWITLTVRNMNGQNRLYKHDFRPVFKAGHAGTWQRIKQPVAFSGSKEADDFEITFRHRFDQGASDPVFFAFCYPWSYAECQALLAEAEARLGASDAEALASDGRSGTARPLAPALQSIYFRRETLTRSIEGRDVDVLTVTAATGASPGGEREPAIPGLFPRGGLRPVLFPERPVYVLSARVHPGETPASHVFNGFLSFILDASDPRARRLRERFVFKLVACLNPDGVVRGHYRLDTQGTNLNRFYVSPDPALHPAIYALRALIEDLHARAVFQFHVDLHGHATKRGCFLFGNHLPAVKDQVETVLYAKLVALNTQVLDLDACVFTQRNMSRKDKRDGLSKEGAGRVALYRLTGAIHCYTLECSYNMGRSVNVLADPTRGKLGPPVIPLSTPAPKYNPAVWGDVGVALAVAVLDLADDNPLSRLAAPGPATAARLDTLRGWCASYVRGMLKRSPASAAVARDAGSGGDSDGEDAVAPLPAAPAGVRRQQSDRAVVAERRRVTAALVQPGRVRRAASSSAVVGGVNPARDDIPGLTDKRLASLSLGDKGAARPPATAARSGYPSLPKARADAAPGVRTPSLIPVRRESSGAGPQPAPVTTTSSFSVPLPPSLTSSAHAAPTPPTVPPASSSYSRFGFPLRAGMSVRAAHGLGLAASAHDGQPPGQSTGSRDVGGPRRQVQGPGPMCLHASRASAQSAAAGR